MSNTHEAFDASRPDRLPGYACAADYMVELARATAAQTGPLAEFVDAKLRSAGFDVARLRAKDSEAIVERLADLFYQFPGELAVPAADALGYPGFLNRVLDRLVEFAGETRKGWLTRDRLYSIVHKDIVRRETIDALLGEPGLRDVVSPLIETSPRDSRGIRQRLGAAISAVWRYIGPSYPDDDGKAIDPNAAKRREALSFLLARPALVRRAAEDLQMAVPFSIVLARELDEISSSRARRSAVDPRAVLVAVKLVAERWHEHAAKLSTGDVTPDERDGALQCEQDAKALDDAIERLTGLVDEVERGTPGALDEFQAIISSLPWRAGRKDGDGAGGGSGGDVRYSLNEAFERNHFGLAFSGGGIRSATVGLGALQALAARNALPQCDYLSTVSGGGYIGSWFLACIKRQQPDGVNGVQQSITRQRTPDPAAERARPIRFLREYSNYLTPQIGLFSVDTWTLISTWCRNTVLNQVVLVLVLGATLIVPRVLAGLVDVPTWLLYGTSLIAFVRACWVIGNNLHVFEPGGDPSRNADDHARVQARIVGPLLVSAITLACAAAQSSIGSSIHVPRPDFVDALVPRWLGDFIHLLLMMYPAATLSFIVLFAGLLIVQLRGGFGQRMAIGQHRVAQWLWNLLFDALGALAGAGIVWVGAYLFVRFHGSLWHAITFGPPLLILAFGTTGVAQIGLLGLWFPDDRREWVSRLGAWLMIYAVLWLALFVCAINGPRLVFWAGVWLSSAAGTAWIASTIGGLIAGTNSKSPTVPGTWADTLASAAMYAFVAGLLLGLAVVIHLTIVKFYAPEPFVWSWTTLRGHYWEYLCAFHWKWMLLFSALMLLGAFGLSARVDVNEFSMHHFYKNRLVRCYLGASRAARRRPNPFTGFDAHDDVRMVELRVAPPNEPDVQKDPFIGPYPVINTTLNLVKGDNLAWQERKGSSFVFTPWYCGFEIPPSDSSAPPSNVVPEAFRPTRQFAYSGDYGIHLGTAAAISGAAASPNSGYQSSPAAAFLMTIFNARLGWWIGNPRRDWRWRTSSPKSGLLYLLAELTGSTNDRSAFVNLSDGGHFENLGLYELVRRRCRYILAIDAEQDGDLTFSALGGAVRKCRIDFGVEIDLDVRMIRHVKTSKLSRLHYAEGTINYPNGDQGILIYVKSSLTADEPADVQQYGSAHAVFPHQSTADQWFSESQFESYRALGQHMVERLCGQDPLTPALVDRSDVNAWFEALQKAIRRATPERA